MRPSPVAKLLILWALIMVAIILATVPEKRPDKMAIPGYATRAADELYFRNVRAFYYTKTDEAEGILEVYRLNSIFDEGKVSSLPLAIYHNWRAHECFIRIDSAYLSAPRPVLLSISPSKVDTLHWPTDGNEEQYAFAYRLFQELKQEGELKLVHPITGETKTLTDSERKDLRMTLKDYFKLIGKL